MYNNFISCIHKIEWSYVLFLQTSAYDVSLFDTKFTKQTPCDSPVDMAVFSPSINIFDVSIWNFLLWLSTTNNLVLRWIFNHHSDLWRYVLETFALGLIYFRFVSLDSSIEEASAVDGHISLNRWFDSDCQNTQI